MSTTRSLRPAARTVAALTMATAVALTFAGCTNDSDGAGNQPSGDTTAPVEASGTPSSRKGTVSPGPKNDLDRRKEVQLTDCEAADGGWKASGTIANKGDDEHEYAITVYFTNDKATDLGDGNTKVSVDGGDKGKWSVTGKFDAPEKVLCVLGPIT